jgi:hypothetical protein
MNANSNFPHELPEPKQRRITLLESVVLNDFDKLGNRIWARKHP